MSKKSESICYLCGREIVRDPKDTQMKQTVDHVPPLQFYPKQIRGQIKGSLITLPTHRCCNESFKEDEEYFVHTYAMHINSHSDQSHYLIQEIKRRSKSKQSQNLLQMIWKEFSDVTPGGVVLPRDLLIHNVNAPRVDRIIRKIVQGLYYHELNQFLPYATPMWIRLYEKPEDMPQVFYKVFCETGSCRGVHKKIFSYRYTKIQKSFYWSMLFWDSLLFCLIVKS